MPTPSHHCANDPRARRLTRLAALIASCSTLGMLPACGGGSDTAPNADSAAASQPHGRRTTQAAAVLPVTSTPIVSSALNACVQAVSTSWDLKLAACNGSSSQKFTLSPVSGSSGVYAVASGSVAGACIKPEGSGAGAGAYVDLNDCDGSTRQQFQLLAQADGTHLQMRNIASGLCLVANAQLNALGFSLATCNSANASQIFSLPGAPAPAPSPAPAPAPTPGPAPAPSPAPAPAPGTWWKPEASTTWQWQLSGTLDTSVNAVVYDIDLFNTDAAKIAQLKSTGHKVVCYFSAGSSENWRSDYARFLPSDKGLALDGWPGENWLDTRSANVRSIMAERLDLARDKGCDGVEPDNVDGYANQSGFALTAADQLDYNRYLATQAHARGLAVALKNDVDQLAALEPSFDFAVNEQCHQYSECGGYSTFTTKNKPVFNAEYASKYVNNTGGARDQLCKAARAANLRTLVLPLALNGSFRYSCD